MSEIDWRQLYASNQAAVARGAASSGTGLRLAPPDRLPGVPSRVGHLATVGAGGDRPLVHVPSGLDVTKAAPLVCMLHGCTQDPATFAAATLMNHAADRHGFVVVYPGQARGRNPQGCWNWFLAEHQQRDLGEPAMIAAIVRNLVTAKAECRIDSQRVYVAGLSSGAAMAVILGACYPDLFAAVAVHSGLAYKSATSMGSALGAMARGAHDRRTRATEPIVPWAPTRVRFRAWSSTGAPTGRSLLRMQPMFCASRWLPTTWRRAETCDHAAEHPTSSWRGQADRGYAYTQSRWVDARGALMHELLMVEGLAHAWSGGAANGSHTDPRGPCATEAIWSFFAATSAEGSTFPA